MNESFCSNCGDPCPEGRCVGCGAQGSPPSENLDDTPVLEDLTGVIALGDLIGRGTFGSVYRASLPGVGEVAVKIYEAPLSRADTRRRFRTELQALPLLKHSNVVTIHRVGTFGGKAAIVMELIKPGRTIADYCREKNLHLPKRRPGLLGLFSGICAGVGKLHACEPRILHRDIKPGNVLVSEDEGKPAPKLLDFGIVKVLDETNSDQRTTVWATHAGTPGYWSPEQRSADPTITPASDVFSLGILLHELLTGRLPRPEEAPGALARSHGEDGQNGKDREIAPSGDDKQRDRADQPAEKVTLPTELASIVRKACAENPQDRYRDATALFEDIQNLIAERPISAMPRTPHYVFSKFLRRHWLKAAAGGILLMAALIALGVWITASLKTKRAEEASRRTLEFLTGDFLSQADPDIQPNRQMSLRQAVDAAAARLEDRNRFQSTPTVEARIRLILGDTYRKLANYHAAEAQFTRAEKVLAGANSGDDLEKAKLAQSQIQLLIDQGRIGEAQAFLIKTVPWHRQRLGKASALTLRAERMAADMQFHSRLHDQASASELLRILEIQKRLVGENHEDTIATMASLARVYRLTNRMKEAKRLSHAVADHYVKAEGLSTPQALRAVREEGIVCALLQERDRAATLLQDALIGAEKVLGPDAPFSLKLSTDLADLLRSAGKLPEAYSLYQRAVEGLSRQLGVWEDNTLAAVEGMALVHAERGQWDAVRKDFAPSMQLDQPSAFERVANVYARYGQLEQASAHLAETLHFDQGTSLTWFRQGVLSLTSGNLSEYSNCVSTMLSKYSQSADPFELTLVLRLAVALTNSMDPALSVATRLESTRPTDAAAVALALNAYRAGNYSKVLALVARTTPEEPTELAEFLLLRAMAHHRLHLSSQAMHEIEEADTAFVKLPRIGLEDLGEQWVKVLLSRLLLREATALILPSASQAAFAVNVPADDRSVGRTLARADELSRLGRTLYREGDAQRAEPMLEECAQIRMRLTPEEWTSGYSQCWLGICLVSQQGSVVGERFLNDGWRALGKGNLLISFEKLQVAEEAVKTYVTRGDSAARAVWQQRRDETPLTLAYDEATRAHKLYHSWKANEMERHWLTNSIRALDDLVTFYASRNLQDKAKQFIRERTLLANAQEGFNQARRGNWQEAAKCYSVAIACDPDDLETWYNATLIAVQTRDEEGYIQRCAAMLQKYGETDDLQKAERVLKATLIWRWRPNPAQQMSIKRLEEFLERQTSAAPDWLQAWLNLVNGIAEYRNSNYQRAIHLFRVSRTMGDPFGSTLAAQFLALAHHRTDDGKASQQALDEAKAQLSEIPSPSEHLADGWRDWIICQAVGREVDEALLIRRR